MGACMSEDSRQDKKVNDELRQGQQKARQVNKLLLLGAGGSGKSTFFKQLQCIHGTGFLDKDRLAFKNHVYHQIIEQMKRLISRSRELIELDPTSNVDLEIGDAGREAADYMEYIRDDIDVNDDIADRIAVLWADPGIQATFKKRAQLGVFDSSRYFFDHVRRVASRNYIPTPQDILLVRHKTTGVTDKLFTIEGTILRIFDVGGQRSERKKWIHCFEDVTAVIFVVSLSGYDEVLYEDETVNVMHDSMTLFSEMCNSRWFQKTPMILFLNKSDLFFDKIKEVPIKIAFPDYNGGDDPDSALQHIKNEFDNRNKHPEEKHLYQHITCATDPDNVEKVFNDVQYIVISDSLEHGGLI